jgi:hypothetical protein
MSKHYISEYMALRGGKCPSCGRFFRPNGVGPEDNAALSSLLSKLPSDHILRYGANFHDWAYHMGSDWGTREDADLLMLQKNRQEILRKVAVWSRWFYYAMNYRNYWAVRIGGKKHFNSKGCSHGEASNEEGQGS